MFIVYCKYIRVYELSGFYWTGVSLLPGVAMLNMWMMMVVCAVIAGVVFGWRRRLNCFGRMLRGSRCALRSCCVSLAVWVKKTTMLKVIRVRRVEQKFCL